MIRAIQNKIKQPKMDFRLIFIGFLLLILIALIITQLNLKEKKSFEIEDRCGKFVNLISHTIEDEPKCRYRCRSQCEGINYKYDQVKFKKSDAGCHSCTCFCK